MARYLIGAQTRIEELEEMLSKAGRAIATLDYAALGFGTDGDGTWSLRDELLERIHRTLEKGKPEEVK